MTKRIISYNKLWKLLIDMGMNKSDLKAVSGISTTSISKLAKCENVYTDVLLKVCEALDCKVEDIIETVDAELIISKQRRKKSGNTKS